MNIPFLLGVATALTFATVSNSTYADSIPHDELLTAVDYETQLNCVAMNIYHEARGDSRLGQKAVGFVTLNRVNSQRYPDTPCDVVYQSYRDSKGNPIRNKCQFSWYCDGKSDRPRDESAWADVQDVAKRVMIEYGVVEDPTDGATMYHASYVNPYWADSYERTVRIDTHIFYK